MKKLLIVVLFVGIVLSVTSQAQAALTFYTDRLAWETAAGTFLDIDIASQVADGDILSTGDSLIAGVHSLSFDIDLEGRQVPDSWTTWSGSQNPRVLYTAGETSVTGTFSDNGPMAFGFEMEPNPMDVYDMTLSLLDGDQTLTQAINGNGGAGFFGWVGDESIQDMTLSSDVDFAFGRFVYTEGQGPVVPEPATLSLLGFGLLGLAGLRKKRV